MEHGRLVEVVELRELVGRGDLVRHGLDDVERQIELGQTREGLDRGGEVVREAAGLRDGGGLDEIALKNHHRTSGRQLLKWRKVTLSPVKVFLYSV